MEMFSQKFKIEKATVRLMKLLIPFLIISCAQTPAQKELISGKRFIKYWMPKYRQILKDKYVKRLVGKKDRTKELTQLSRIGLSMLSYQELDRKRSIGLKIIKGLDLKSCESLFAGRSVTENLLKTIGSRLSVEEQYFWADMSEKSIMLGSALSRGHRPGAGRLTAAMRVLYKTLNLKEKEVYMLITEGKKPLNQLGQELCEFNKIIHEKVSKLPKIDQSQILQAFVFDFVFTLDV